MKRRIEENFLTELTLEALFNQFIDPSIKKKFNAYIIFGTVLLFIFILLCCFYSLKDYNKLILILPILVLPILAYMSFWKAEQIRNAGISEVLAIFREIEAMINEVNGVEGGVVMIKMILVME